MPAISLKYLAGSLAFCISLGLGVSAEARLAPDPLVQVWVAKKPLQTVKACVVKALDKQERTYSRISPSIRHSAKARVPGQVVDIKPVNGHFVADTHHHVRLEKITDGITRIEFFSSDDSKKPLELAVAACSS